MLLFMNKYQLSIQVPLRNKFPVKYVHKIYFNQVQTSSNQNADRALPRFCHSAAMPQNMCNIQCQYQKKNYVMNTILWQGRFYLFQERQIYASSMGIHVSYCRWHDLLIFFFDILWHKNFTEFCIAKFYESYIGKE